MCRVELKEDMPVIVVALAGEFLMCRVELKDMVWSIDKLPYRNLFLMCRVELKEGVKGN